MLLAGKQVFCGAEHAALGVAHGVALGRGAIVETGEVEQAMDEIEGEFVGGRAAEAAGDDDGALGADDDFPKAVAKIKADDIGGADMVEELPVDDGDGDIINESDAEFDEVRSAEYGMPSVAGVPPSAFRFPHSENLRGSLTEEPKQSCSCDRQVALAIAEADPKRHRTLGFHPWNRRCECEACLAAFV